MDGALRVREIAWHRAQVAQELYRILQAIAAGWSAVNRAALFCDRSPDWVDEQSSALPLGKFAWMAWLNRFLGTSRSIQLPNSSAQRTAGSSRQMPNYAMTTGSD
jgi:hypothetical protein